MLPTSLPGGIPGGITAARPTSPRAASRASVGIDATSSGVLPAERGDRQVRAAVRDAHDVLHRGESGRAVRPPGTVPSLCPTPIRPATHGLGRTRRAAARRAAAARQKRGSDAEGSSTVERLGAEDERRPGRRGCACSRGSWLRSLKLLLAGQRGDGEGRQHAGGPAGRVEHREPESPGMPGVTVYAGWVQPPPVVPRLTPVLGDSWVMPSRRLELP